MHAALSRSAVALHRKPPALSHLYTSVSCPFFSDVMRRSADPLSCAGTTPCGGSRESCRCDRCSGLSPPPPTSYRQRGCVSLLFLQCMPEQPSPPVRTTRLYGFKPSETRQQGWHKCRCSNNAGHCQLSCRRLKPAPGSSQSFAKAPPPTPLRSALRPRRKQQPEPLHLERVPVRRRFTARTRDAAAGRAAAADARGCRAPGAARHCFCGRPVQQPVRPLAGGTPISRATAATAGGSTAGGD